MWLFESGGVACKHWCAHLLRRFFHWCAHLSRHFFHWCAHLLCCLHKCVFSFLSLSRFSYFLLVLVVLLDVVVVDGFGECVVLCVAVAVVHFCTCFWCLHRGSRFEYLVSVVVSPVCGACFFDCLGSLDTCTSPS